MLRVALLLAAGLSFLLLPEWEPQMTGAAPLGTKHCFVVKKTVHGKMKKVKVCPASAPTRTPAPAPTRTPNRTPTRTPTPTPTPTPLFGNHAPSESLAVFIVQLPGMSQTPTQDDLQPFLDGAGYPQQNLPSLKDFYMKEAGITYGRITVEPAVTMPDDMFAAIPACNQGQLLADDYLLALAYYPDILSRYDQVMFFNSEQPECLWNAGSLPGYGGLGRAVSVVNYNSEDPRVTAWEILHESGHAAFRLNHAKTRVDGVVHEYGSLGTVMGSTHGVGLNIVDRRIIGSTTSHNVGTVAASGDYTICPRELLRPSCVQDLRIPMTDNEGYYAGGTRAWMNVELDTESASTPTVRVLVWDELMNGVADPDWDIAGLSNGGDSFSDPNAKVTVNSLSSQGAVVHVGFPGQR